MSRAPDEPGDSGAAAPSLLWRVARTPLSDILRGRLTCRLDFEAVIADSRLPAPAADRIREVVRRTRLWRSERAEVAAELVAHFADALDAGRSPEDAAAAFGDPVRAALLIRRAKKRSRPLAWRTWVRFWQCVGILTCVLLAIYAALAGAMLLRHPTLSRNISAEINATLPAVAESQRAWPVYCEAITRLAREPETAEAVTGARPSSPDWDAAVAYCTTNRDAYALVRRAASMPVLGLKVSSAYDPLMVDLMRARAPVAPESLPESVDNPPAYALLVPHIGEFRSLARHLALDMRVAADTGDGRRVVEDFDALVGIAGHCCQPRFLISQLQSLAIFHVGVQSFGEVLASQPRLFSDADLAGVAHRLAGFQGGRITMDLSSERLAMVDTAQRVYSDNGSGDGRLTVEGIRFLHQMVGRAGRPPFDFLDWLGAPGAGAAIANRRDTMETFDRLMDRAQSDGARPLWEWNSTPADEAIDLLESGSYSRMRYPLIAALMPAVSRVFIAAEQGTMRRDGLLTAIALEMFRRAGGKYPERLDELVPTFLPAVPPDRFDGAPLRYRLIDGRPVVYSIGSDRDDDGGRPGATNKQDASRWYSPGMMKAKAAIKHDPAPIPDADWVLWPPVRYDPESGALIEGTPQ